MNYLTSFLEQIKKSEHLDQRTDKTDKSIHGATEAALTSVPATIEATDVSTTMAMDDPMNGALGQLCDDCHRPTAVALVTSYGSRYCRSCVFPAAATTKKRGAS